MSSIAHRIAALFRIKANKVLDRAEDPRKVLDYSYAQQLQMLQKVRRGVADVATSHKRVELQVMQLQQSTGKLEGQARQALAVGREDLAHEALTRRTAVVSQITDLQGQQASLQDQEERLTRAAAAGEGGSVPHPQGDDQGHLHRGRSADEHQRGHHRRRRGDGRCRSGHAVRPGQDRAIAGARRSVGRADRLWRAGGRHSPDRL